jgi:hypothetical protein
MGIAHPVWKNLEVYIGEQENGVIRCTTCNHVFCEKGGERTFMRHQGLTKSYDLFPLESLTSFLTYNKRLPWDICGCFSFQGFYFFCFFSKR